MKKDGIQTRNRKLASKGKKKRGSVVDFFSPFVNINSDRLPFASYSNMSNTTNSPYTGLSANPINAGNSSSPYPRYGDLSSTAAMSQYYSGMAGQMTSQFMAAAAQQAVTPVSHSNHHVPSMPNTNDSDNNDTCVYPVPVNEAMSNHHLPSHSFPQSLGSSGSLLGEDPSPSSVAAVAAASFGAFTPSSMSIQAAAAPSVGATIT